MRKSKAFIALALVGATMLSGCTPSAEVTAATITAKPIVSTDEITVTQAATASDEELRGVVYNFVTSNITIDPKDLINPTEAELELILNKMDKIVFALRGKDNNSISDSMLNYILWELSKTQNEWKVSDNGITVVGIDPATRKVFVDLTFETIEDDSLKASNGVTYSQEKVQIPASRIIQGDPYEASLKNVRKEQYLNYLVAWYEATYGTSNITSFWGSSATDNTESLQQAMNDKRAEFEEVWGTLDSVMLEQQELSLVERIRYCLRNRDKSVSVTYDYDEFYDLTGQKPENFNENTPFSDEELHFVQARGIGTHTYTGIAKQTTFNNAATMRFRFVLDFDFNLGADATMTTTSVYLMNYTRGSRVEDATDPEWGTVVPKLLLENNSSASIDVLSPYLDRLINSYQKCMEESDYAGLYKLFGTQKLIDSFSNRVMSTTSRFADWDKYYSDMNRYCYVDFDNYDYQIVGWEGNTLQVIVNRAKKIRAKGTEMTMPTYEEKVLLTIVIDQDDVFLESETILQTTLVGEPVSMIKEVTGIADKIAYDSKSFTVANEIGVLEAVKKFSKAQLAYAQDSSIPMDTSVLDITSGEYEEMQRLMSLDKYKYDDASKQWVLAAEDVISPSEKITWMGTWASKSNVYCKVRIREYFITDKMDIDTEAYVGLVNRNGTWVVVSYERTLNRELRKSKSITDKGCLTHDYVNKESTSDYVMPTTDLDSTAAGVVDTDNTTSGTVQNLGKYNLPSAATAEASTVTIHAELKNNKTTLAGSEDEQDTGNKPNKPNKPNTPDKPTEGENTEGTENGEQANTDNPIAGNLPGQPGENTEQPNENGEQTGEQTGGQGGTATDTPDAGGSEGNEQGGTGGGLPAGGLPIAPF